MRSDLAVRIDAQAAAFQPADLLERQVRGYRIDDVELLLNVRSNALDALLSRIHRRSLNDVQAGDCTPLTGGRRRQCSDC